MAINVRPELFLSRSETSNKECVRQEIGQIFPATNNITGNILNGDVIFNLTTGADEWLDLYKLNIAMRFVPTYVAVASMDEYMSCVFDRAQMYINGALVAASNNYTEDNILNKRLAFSAGYNTTINGMNFAAPAAGTGGDAVVTLTNYTVLDHLDALFIRTPNLFVPPNSEVRLIFTCAVNNGVNKATRVDAAAGMLTTAVSSIWLNTYTITRPDKVPESYELTLITPDSFKASISTAALDIQHMTKANLVRLSAFFISTAATTAVTAGVNKLYTVPYFRYVTDGFAGATALLNLYFKAGNQQIPQRQFDNTFQFTDAWNQFAEMTDKGFDPAGCETEANWLIKGPIYTVPVIRSIKDTSRNIELHGNFTAAPAALAYLVAHYEQHLTFTYDSYGSPSGALIKSV